MNLAGYVQPNFEHDKYYKTTISKMIMYGRRELSEGRVKSLHMFDDMRPSDRSSVTAELRFECGELLVQRSVLPAYCKCTKSKTFG